MSAERQDYHGVLNAPRCRGLAGVFARWRKGTLHWIVGVFGASAAVTFLGFALFHDAPLPNSDARLHTTKKLAIPSGGELLTAPVLSEFLLRTQLIFDTSWKPRFQARMAPAEPPESTASFFEDDPHTKEWWMRQVADATQVTALAQRSVSKRSERNSDGPALKQRPTLDAVKQATGALEAYLEQAPRAPLTNDARQRSVAQLETQVKLVDEDTWRSVSPIELPFQVSYRTDFTPRGDIGDAPHANPKIAAASSRDADAVLAALEKYSRAWNAKDIADIVALRPALDRRTVKEELSSVRSVVMRIRPISNPQIAGDRAIIDCIHEVDEVFNDGIKRENAGARMRYVLVRRGDNWLIEDSH